MADPKNRRRRERSRRFIAWPSITTVHLKTLKKSCNARSAPFWPARWHALCSIFTQRRLLPRLRLARSGRLRCRMHGRIGTSLLPLLSRLHSERHRIGLPWAGNSYRLDLHTSLFQTWVLLLLPLIGHCRIWMQIRGAA